LRKTLMNALPPMNHKSLLICNPNKNISFFSKKFVPKKNSHCLLAQHHCEQLLADAHVDPIGYIVPYLPAPHATFSCSSMRIQKVSWVMFHSSNINALIAPATVGFIACSFRQEP
jgi:hypothetical protein